MSSPHDLTQMITHLQQTKEHFAADTDIRPIDCYKAYTLLTSMLDVISGEVADMAKTLITLLCDFHSICQEHTVARNRQWHIITQQLDELTTTLAEISQHIPATEPLPDRPPTDTTTYRQVSAA